MAKRMMALAVMLAALLAIAVPALAQETEEEAVTGVVEAIDTNPKGTSPFGLYVEEFGTGFFLRGVDEDFAAFEGQEVTVYGTREVIADGAIILDVTRVEPTADASGEEVAITGVVFEDDDFSDGTLYNVRDEATDEVYLLTGGPGSDFEPYLDQRATVYGTFVDEEPNGNVGTYLSVSRVELAGSAAGGQGGTTTGETTMGETTTVAGSQYEDGGGTPAAAGIDLNEDGAVDEADGDFAVQTNDEVVTTTPAEGALPGTGGLVLPVAGIAGAALLACGLFYHHYKLAS